MYDYPSNFGNKTKCDLGCPETLKRKHILVCSKLNEQGSNYQKFELILEGTMNQKLYVFHRIKENIYKQKKTYSRLQLKIVNCKFTVFTV